MSTDVLPHEPPNRPDAAPWVLGFIAAVFVAYSLAPFELDLHTGRLTARAARLFEPSRQAIGDWTSLLPHVLVFAAFGTTYAMAYRASTAIVTRAAIVIALPVECAQILIPHRHPHVLDLFVHVASAVLAAAAFKRIRQRAKLPALQSAPAVAAVLLAALCLAWIGFLASAGGRTSLDTWDPSYNLHLANEATGDRPWLGAIRSLRLYDRPVAPAASSTVQPIAAYDFNQPPDGHRAKARRGPDLFVSDHNAVTRTADGHGWHLHRPTRLSTEQAPGRLINTIIHANAFTVEMTIRPDNLEQQGPARIVSLSKSPAHRNFTIGQAGDGLVFRVRTAVSGPNGNRPELRIRQPVLTRGWHHVAASCDRGRMNISVDGQSCGELDMGAAPAMLALGTNTLADLAAAIIFTWPVIILLACVRRSRVAAPANVIACALVIAGVFVAGAGARAAIDGITTPLASLAYAELILLVVLAALVTQPRRTHARHSHRSA